MTAHDLELNRFYLMISVCEKYRDKMTGEGKKRKFILSSEKRKKETKIISNLKKQLEKWQQDVKNAEVRDGLTSQIQLTHKVTE